MPSKLSHTDIGFSRCAVCKIDLKGRFVYIDDKIEHLLGYSKEELFGKTFLEFLDEPSQHLINQLLSHRNNYETFYDAATITLINRDRKSVSAKVVVTLNFIAGNPVNYQLIIDSSELSSQTISRYDASDEYKLFLECLLQLKNFSDWKKQLEIICRFVNAQQACLYLIKNDKLEPRSIATNENSAEFIYKEIPETTSLHQRVAQKGEEYSFIDQTTIQNVIESDGKAPNEFVTRVKFNDGNHYLLRLIFSDDFDTQIAQDSITRAKLAIRLLEKIMDVDEVQGSSDDVTSEIKFTIGFLDSLGIPAFLNDREGNIIGYNPSIIRFFSEEQLNGTYLNVIKSISEYNSSGLERKIIDYINSSYDKDSPFDLKLPVKLSMAETANLTVIKISDASDDLSACFVFTPGSPVETCSVLIEDHKMWHSITSFLKRALKTFLGVTEKLSHEFYNELGKDGNRYLTDLNENIKNLNEIVGGLSFLLRMTGRAEKPRITNLNLLINQVMQKHISNYPNKTINCSYKNLPKVKVPQRVLTVIINNIISNCIKFNDKPAININIEAEIKKNHCYFRIKDNGIGISEERLLHLFDFFYRLPEQKVHQVDRNGLGLAITKKLVEALSGEISMSSVEGEGTSVTISLPVEG